MLQLNKITFAYNNHLVIDGVSTQFKPGCFVGIIGANGSGKTTLMKCLNGDLDLVSGEILLGEERIKGPSEKHISGDFRIKLVKQDAKVSENMTVWENMEMCFRQRSADYIHERSTFLLEQVGLDHHLELKPKQLSGGQKQRLALARALAEEPEYLLLDEPFSQVDKHDTYRLLSALDNLRHEQNIGILYISHHPEYILNFVEELCVLESGKIIQQNKPWHVYENPVNSVTAGLTGLFNEIHGKIYRPEELKLGVSGIKSQISRMLKLGSSFIAECKSDKQIFYVQHPNREEKGKTVYIEIK